MSLFKRLFGKKKNEESPDNSKPQQPPLHDIKGHQAQQGQTTNEPEEEGVGSAFSGIASEEHFERRYTLDTEDNSSFMADCYKILEGYYPANKIERLVASPMNHPKNLDQAVDDGFGFTLYCEAMKLPKGTDMVVLAQSFAEFLVERYKFKKYIDAEPEYPLRKLTLKYDEDGMYLSCYPLEFASKVLAYQASFEEFVEKIENHMLQMKAMNDQVKNFIGGDDGPVD